jgi:hypothetical protein
MKKSVDLIRELMDNSQATHCKYNDVAIINKEEVSNGNCT